MARALISDPDIAFFLLFLTSNRARKQAIDLSGKINTILQNLEGTVLLQKTVPAEASQRLQESVKAIDDLVKDGGIPSDKLLERVRNDADQYTRAYLLPNAKSGTRRQTKGEDAVSKIESVRFGLDRDWFFLRDSLYYLSPLVPVSWNKVLPYALSVPSNSLRKTVEMEYPPDKASDYLLQLVASVASLEAMKNPPDFFYRYQINEGISVPAKTRIVETAEVGGFITEFQVRDSAGSTVPPALLGIHVYDTVLWGGGDGTVRYVSGDTVFLEGSTIPLGSSPVVQIESGAGRQFKTMRQSIMEWTPTVPFVPEFKALISPLKTGSLAEVQQTARKLADISARLHPIDSDTLLALDRLDITPPAVPVLSQFLLLYDPQFLKRTKDAARDALDTLRADNFDYAEGLLLSGGLDDLFSLSYAGASYKSRFATSSYTFNRSVSEEKPPSFLRPRYGRGI